MIVVSFDSAWRLVRRLALAATMRLVASRLNVPLPRADVRFVEVVQVEDHVPLGRRVRAEVQEMGVTTDLDVNTGRRRAGEVAGHDQRRAAEEVEP